jgi:hypothetical protein
MAAPSLCERCPPSSRAAKATDFGAFVAITISAHEASKRMAADAIEMQNAECRMQNVKANLFMSRVCKNLSHSKQAADKLDIVVA